MPASLADALATEPLWLKGWLGVLVVTLMLAVVFVVRRAEGRWRIRPEPVAILASLFAAGLFMEWLYAQVGYVRLLGLAHLVCWTPVYIWVLARRRSIGTKSLFGKWIGLYLVVVTISLVIDLVDLIRYLAGDGQLIN